MKDGRWFGPPWYGWGLQAITRPGWIAVGTFIAIAVAAGISTKFGVHHETATALIVTDVVAFAGLVFAKSR